jgi:integrative and conjugative element protein (TIGR02256 family)
VNPSLFVHRGVFARFGRLPARPYEVGGWLLGYWAEDRSSLLLTHATPPLSRGTPYGVRVSGRGHRKLFDAAWDATEGHVTYLGDWHTHPGSPPLPSPRDQRALEQLANDPSFDTPVPLIAIVSTPRFPWQEADHRAAFYIGDKAGMPTALNPVPVDELPDEAAGVPEWRWPTGRRDVRCHAQARLAARTGPASAVAER